MTRPRYGAGLRSTGFNSATASPPWMTMMWNLEYKGYRDGFNSATASPPWMTTDGEGEALLLKALQFGHGVAAVDDLDGEAKAERRRQSFNSATASPPWMTPSCGPPSRRSPFSFNSATASPPWMTQF